MKGGGIEIRSVWPHESSRFRIHLQPIEEVQTSKGTEELTTKHWLEVDHLLCMVLEQNADSVGSQNVEPFDPVDWMNHVFIVILKAQWAARPDQRAVTASPQNRLSSGIFLS